MKRLLSWLTATAVVATAADVRLRFTANTGAPAGQVAEFQVIGEPAANPDLQISALTWSPASPSESDPVTLSATVRNAGDRQSGATNVKFYFGDTVVGTADVGTLAAGGTTTVTANIGARDAGSYPLRAVVDEDNTVVEKVETNNTFTSANALVVSAVPTSDLIASPVNWSPTNPQNGATVNFSVAIRNQGTVASAGGVHGITLTVKNATTGAVVATLSGSFSGTIAPGAVTSPVGLGSWTAANGRYTVTTVIAADADELPAKQGNNTSTQNLFGGRGANMPPGDYQTSGKFTVYLKSVRVVGAGPWYTRFVAPSGQENTDVGFRMESSANGSGFSGFAYFGNYTSRIDGPARCSTSTAPPTRRSRTSGSSTWCACTGASTPTT